MYQRMVKIWEKLLQNDIAPPTNLHMVKTDVLLDDSYKCCALANKSVNKYFELFLIGVPTLVWFMFSKVIRSNIWIKFLGLIETSFVVKLLLLDTFFSIMGKVVVFKVKGKELTSLLYQHIWKEWPKILEFDVYSWLARRVCNHVDSELLIDTELCWLTRQYEVKHLLYIEENSWQSITKWKLMSLKFSWVVMLKFVPGDIGGWQRLIKKLKLFCRVTGA